PATDGEPWREEFAELVSAGRATTADVAPGLSVWVATERWPLVRSIWPNCHARPEVNVPSDVRQHWPPEEAISAIVRGRMECTGPTTVEALARTFGLESSQIEGGLLALENDGA